MMRRQTESLPPQGRLTVSLAPGHRKALEAIAERNNTTLAFVVRYALTEFISDSQGKQLALRFPPELLK